MLRKIIKFVFRAALILVGTGLVALLLPRAITSIITRNKIHTVDDAPNKSVAIVFGAGLLRDGSPTAVLRDRVRIAADLYFAGKVQILLMSGDNTTIYYDEPSAMREYALALGVPDDAIVRDFAGRRTYDTCYRAKDIFGVSDAILVTQAFHLPRAMYTCQQMGIDVAGVVADLRPYATRQAQFWEVRETIATLFALVDVHLTQPKPVLGNPEPIFSQEAQ